nr:CRISPR-associated helicase Cas3' [Micromonospora sp. DSM 115978]
MTGSSHPALAGLWGKSDAEGSVNLLLQHLFDAAAVGECLWDRYLAPVVRDRLDAVTDGRGRTFLALLCGLHDVGKATPAFQNKVPELAKRLLDHGLPWRELTDEASRWHHSSAGAVIVERVLGNCGWDRDSVDLSWLVVAGHHGLIPEDGVLRMDTRARKQGQGGKPWEAAQDAVVCAVASALGMDLTTFGPVRLPTRADQLAISGLVIMADWIASGQGFAGVDSIGGVSMERARRRANAAMERLRIRGGWSVRPYRQMSDLIAERFGRPARESQSIAIALAERMPAPGLLIIEAPMGEGKTEGALSCAEVLAMRFGADGIFVGMPTQATCDPMFTRVRRWADALEPDLPVGLLHGKRRFNKEWSDLRSLSFGGVEEDGRDEYGCDDLFGTGSGPHRVPDAVPAEWFLGNKRGLLMPLTVGTVDQLLHAATRTKHVMLRHAGLAGRVVVLDEVHAYDVYTSQFLFEALRWLAGAGVPTILLSATLPPAMRADLMRAWIQGATGAANVKPIDSADVDGYPAVRSVSVVDGVPRFEVAVAPPWRNPISVAVEIRDEDPSGDPKMVADVLREALVDGGCALVIRNTVGRAQQTYQELRKAFGEDVLLLHARLTAGERADRTQRALRMLGTPDDEDVQRPGRLVIVATQVAEQSFDVDADILVTDLAPIDLLLQRIGRIHRHERPHGARPARVRAPRVVAVGMKTRPGESPLFPRGSEVVYSRHPLLRAAALVIEAQADGGWSIPIAVPELVRRGYGDEELTPATWQESVNEAHIEWMVSQTRRRSRAEPFLLAGEGGLGLRTLVGLHRRATGQLPDDDAVAAVVRDGPESVEVVLVRQDGRQYLTLAGRSMGVNGEAVSDPEVAEEVIQSTVRLPGNEDLTAAAKKELVPLPGWAGDAWLRRARALVLDSQGSILLAGHRLTYHHDLGLVDEWL